MFIPAQSSEIGRFEMVSEPELSFEKMHMHACARFLPSATKTRTVGN